MPHCGRIWRCSQEVTCCTNVKPNPSAKTCSEYKQNGQQLFPAGGQEHDAASLPGVLDHHNGYHTQYAKTGIVQELASDLPIHPALNATILQIAQDLQAQMHQQCQLHLCNTKYEVMKAKKVMTLPAIVELRPSHMSEKLCKQQKSMHAIRLLQAVCCSNTQSAVKHTC